MFTNEELNLIYDLVIDHANALEHYEFEENDPSEVMVLRSIANKIKEIPE